MAVDMFLAFEGDEVEGESMDAEHEGEIDILAWSWGMNQSGTMHIAKGGGAGKVNVQDISFTKWIDKATPNLMQSCTLGSQFDKATLTCRKASGEDEEQVDYLMITMENVIISSISTGGSGGEDRFTENLVLNFGKFTVTYTPQENDGTALPEVGPIGWDMQTNTVYTG